jgi:hypothetical protein
MGELVHNFYLTATDDAAGFWEETTISSAGILGT